MKSITIDFKKYSSIQIGTKQKVKLIDKIDNYPNYTIIGQGNNILLSNNPPKLAILSKKFDYIKQKDNILIVGASTSSSKLLRYCKKHDIANFEFFTKLPGFIGGLTKMNAGLKEWDIFSCIKSIKTAKGNIDKKDISFGYRYTSIQDIIYEVSFHIQKGFSVSRQNIFKNLRKNQPNLPSAGSCFKNPKQYSAGYLLEKVGLKGYTIGDMGFSKIHANFLVNYGNGNYNEAIKLITLAKQKVKEQFDIQLKEEIIIL
jgi:UDP-N-acetylmuramate dehydrogenase